MKVFLKVMAALFVLSSVWATFAVAQIPQGTFKHIIIVVQENRTPDNLFGAAPGPLRNCGQENQPFEPGVDIDNGGLGIPYKQAQQLICNIPLHLTGLYNPCPGPYCTVGIIVDPDHSHQGKPPSGGWVGDYDGGNMDGFCHEYDNSTWNGVCPSYSYVPQSDVQPYYDIANSYGFANYMFQTNEGPSLPAHQFLFAGTSAPVPYQDSSGEWTWFDADLVFQQGGNDTCTSSVIAPLIDPTGFEPTSSYCTQNPNDPHCTKIPCYERAPSPYNWGSLADLLGANNVSWKYYSPSKNPDGSINDGLWVAPASINHFCDSNGSECVGLISGTYAGNMRWETKQNPYPVVDDINSCALAAVNWAIPDARWSDHAGENNGSGPSYVANIVNAIGKSTCKDGEVPYWNDTAIFIVWDDWGGWYDHINPNPYPGVRDQENCDQWGCAYTYGFRVPLLVVSAYTQAGYVSGACGATGQPSCPNNVAPFVHDFGSILAFIE